MQWSWSTLIIPPPFQHHHIVEFQDLGSVAAGKRRPVYQRRLFQAYSASH